MITRAKSAESAESETEKKEELHTESPLSERDEMKHAEAKTARQQEKATDIKVTEGKKDDK